MKILDSIKKKLVDNFGYKFEKGDEVKAEYRGTRGEGVVLDRSFPFNKWAPSFIPSKLYTVQLQDKYKISGKEMILNGLKVVFKEKNLEKLVEVKTR